MQSNQAESAALAGAVSGAAEALARVALALNGGEPVAKPQRQVADPVTVAYIGYGVRQAMSETTDFDHEGGEVALMETIIKHAADLDAECERLYGGAGFPGVFAYEVAEPFGYRYATALRMEGGKADPWEIIRNLFDQVTPFQADMAIIADAALHAEGMAKKDAPKCSNSNPGTFNHECGAPATWSATTPKGTPTSYCDHCKEHGYEAVRATNFQRLS